MVKNHEKDEHYAVEKTMIIDFIFDEKVAKVFPDMIRRSVPGYDGLMTQIGLFSTRYAQDNSNLYDLGCSTGATSLALANQINAKGCTLFAIDNSLAMTERCQQTLSETSNLTAKVICADINDIVISNASIVTMNFTLQFIQPKNRQALLFKINNGLRDNGILVLSEKINFSDDRDQTFHNEMHLLFKKANGYSEMEISQKRTALENVLIPDTIETHFTRLKQAGFAHITVWFQSFNFVSIFAQKI